MGAIKKKVARGSWLTAYCAIKPVNKMPHKAPTAARYFSAQPPVMACGQNRLKYFTKFTL